MNFLSVREAVAVVVANLERHRMDFAALMTKAGLPQEMGHILPYYSDNVDEGMYPLLMVSQSTKRTSWIGIPNVGEQAVSLDIWGAVHWDNELQREDAVGLLADGVEEFLNLNHLPLDLGGGREVYYTGDMPVSNVQFGALGLGGVFVRAFVAKFNANFMMQAVDERGRVDPVTGLTLGGPGQQV